LDFPAAASKIGAPQLMGAAMRRHAIGLTLALGALLPAPASMQALAQGEDV